MSELKSMDAIWKVFTPTGPIDCCATHAEQVVALYNFMGAQVYLHPILGESVECVNCLNSKDKGE